MLGPLACPTCHHPLPDGDTPGLCKHCGTVYPRVDDIPVLLPRVASSHLAALEAEYWSRRFDREADGADLCRALSGPALDDDWGILSYVAEILQRCPPPARILEVGCGLGAQAAAMAVQHGYHAVVTDLALPAVAAVKSAVARVERDANIGFCVADAASLPFPDGAFDVVLVHATLHHLDHPAAAIQEMSRCLRAGGLLVLGHEPNRRAFEPLRRIADRLRITEKHTQRFVEGMYSQADEVTPGFFGWQLQAWVAQSGLRLEWLTPVWYLAALLYNLPVLTQITIGRPVEAPRDFRRLAVRLDQQILRHTPGLRQLGLFWTLGALKITSPDAGTGAPS